MKEVSWVGDISAAIDRPNKVLIHLRPACSLNRMCYTGPEMMLAARSLAGKPIFTNHSPVMKDGKLRSEGMYVHADWNAADNEVLGIGFLYDRHLWEEIKLHGRAPVSQRTHYFKSYKQDGFEYPEGIVFDEASLIVDDEKPGKPGDYVEVLESAHAVLQSQVESWGFTPLNPPDDITQKIGEMKMSEEQNGEEQATPPLAKLSKSVSFAKGRFAGPSPPKRTIRDTDEQTRYGQGYREPPASAVTDLPAEYGPALNYARIRGGPGADIPFGPARVQMPGRGGQPSAEPTAKPHMENKEKINMDVPQKSGTMLNPTTTPSRHLQAMPPRRETPKDTVGLMRPLEGVGDAVPPGASRGVTQEPGYRRNKPGFIKAPPAALVKPGSPSGNESDAEDDEDDEDDDEDDEAKAAKKRSAMNQDGGDGGDGEDNGDGEDDGDDGEDDGEASEAVWTTSYVNSLPNSAFAMPKERKYPHHKKDGSIDRAHVVNCAQRAAQQNAESALAHCRKHMSEMSIGEFAKTAQERLQWERYAESIAPFAVIEEALWKLANHDEALEARVAAFIDEALNKEFAKHKIGGFMRMFGPRLMQMEMEIERLKDCAAEMKPGLSQASESAPVSGDSIEQRVIDSLTAKAREIVNKPLDEHQLQPLSGRHTTVEYAKRQRRNSLRQLGFDV